LFAARRKDAKNFYCKMHKKTLCLSVLAVKKKVMPH